MISFLNVYSFDQNPADISFVESLLIRGLKDVKKEIERVSFRYSCQLLGF